MKHILPVLAAALATGFFATAASAQTPVASAPGYATISSGGAVVQPVAVPAAETAGCCGKSGFHPFAKLFNRGGCSGCSSCGLGLGGSHAGLKGNIAHPQKAPPPPVATGGTLVFPNHQFVRSPRDFFMQDQ